MSVSSDIIGPLIKKQQASNCFAREIEKPPVIAALEKFKQDYHFDLSLHDCKSRAEQLEKLRQAEEQSDAHNT